MRIPKSLVLLALSACSTSTKPCTKGGDTSWVPPIKGNSQCFQKELPNGEFQNHGKFTQWHKNGVLALEGQFVDGKKDGVWIYYDEKGEKKAEKFFKNGVETSDRH